jgi:hypothetical protein
LQKVRFTVAAKTLTRPTNRDASAGARVIADFQLPIADLNSRRRVNCDVMRFVV